MNYHHAVKVLFVPSPQRTPPNCPNDFVVKRAIESQGEYQAVLPGLRGSCVAQWQYRTRIVSIVHERWRSHSPNDFVVKRAIESQGEYQAVLPGLRGRALHSGSIERASFRSSTNGGDHTVLRAANAQMFCRPVARLPNHGGEPRGASVRRAGLPGEATCTVSSGLGRVRQMCH